MQLTLETTSPDQRFSAGLGFLPGGHLSSSGDILSCHSSGGATHRPGILLSILHCTEQPLPHIIRPIISDQVGKSLMQTKDDHYNEGRGYGLRQIS